MTAITPKQKSLVVKIDDLIESGDLWVKNTTPTTARRNLCMNYNNFGRVDTEVIPNTPHPIHLSNRVPKDMLRGNKDLRDFISRKALTVVMPEEAEAYYAGRPEAADAVDRAYSKLTNTSAPSPLSRETMVKMDPNASQKQIESSQQDRAALLAEASNVKVVSQLPLGGAQPQVMMIVANVNNKESPYDSDQAILDLLNIDLTKADLEYVVAESTGHLKERAKDMLARLS